ncbi:tRNA dimethylallyltransferase [Allopseudospirillum japonicum]|uniref:tRNA dimethylallyltransferase n=1 Tax=Allopseudospirillum japonicum TaxID=64971 RepID=A0A1H6QKY3_9GAMM|nr:tRNA (adenosine(37)-N6)-dimethylallyltransferase MiaA [Allopseudospirillum japonicum]SEI41614.1 tRNA dimethylallyltransferase [Allopseudospirillum japonicum]
MKPRLPVIALMGPTAAGKTDWAIQLHQEFACDLISVDSALVYSGMDIGTAKPDAATLAKAPHQLIDIRDPAQAYSAAEFREDALVAIANSHAQGRVPVLVGGTMLYFKRLLEGGDNLPSANAEIRAELEAQAAAQGWPALHARLAQVDPVSAQRIHPNDPQRLQRALEVFLITGRALSALWAEQKTPELTFELHSIALIPQERAHLHERIAQRFRLMLQQGLLEEVEGLKARADLHLGLPSMRAVGYRQVWQYLDGAFDYASLQEKGIVATRQLAKRQLTWLRSWPDLQIFHPEQVQQKSAFLQHVQACLREIN